MKNIIFIFLTIINLLGFILMYIDKKRAIKHEWRISENTLMAVATIGGSIGSLLGMYCLDIKQSILSLLLEFQLF